MSIKEIRKLLKKKSDGNISTEEEILLEQYYSQLLEQGPQENSNDRKALIAKERMRLNIHSRIQPGRSSYALLLRRHWPRVAAIFMVVATGGYWGYTFRSVIISALHPMKEIEVAAYNQAVKRIVLPDSSVVLLKKGSRLKYPASFTGPERKVTLEGEAYYEVIHDARQPFIVQCGNLSVKDIGTSFVVSAFTDHNETQVTVLTGQVNVLEGNDAISSLHPNQQLTVNKLSGRAERRLVNAADFAVWIHPGLGFNGTSLREVFTTLEKEYHIGITGASPALLQTSFSGDFPAGEGIGDIFNTLSAIFNFTYSFNDEKTVIHIRLLTDRPGGSRAK